jgi:hypothetical protein
MRSQRGWKWILSADGRHRRFGVDEPDVWPRMKQKFKLEAFEGRRVERTLREAGPMVTA